MAKKKTIKSEVRRAGRPIGDRDTRDMILDAAEREFALSGYANTSLRVVAEHVNFNQALINYYFGSKQNLFEEVIKRRGKEMSRRHIELLSALEEVSNPVPLKQLIGAFLTPPFEMRDRTPNGLAFMRLLARLHFEPSEMAIGLRREIYDISTKRYVKAFMRALPDVHALDILWRTNFIVGSMLYMFSGSYRIHDLSDGEYTESWDLEEIIERMTIFIIGGLSSPTYVSRPK